MGTTAQKLEYLGTTKSQLKDMINYGLDENKITSSTTFRNYVSSVKEAFLEALRTPDTLFTNLPKKSASGSNISLTGVANAPMRIELSPSELTQASTPTPSSPQEVHTISGSNKVVVCGKNLMPIKNQDFTINGIRFQAIDGSIKISGTATANVTGFDMKTSNKFPVTLEAGTYYFSRNLTDTSAGLIKTNNISIVSLSSTSTATSTTFTLAEKTQLYLYFYIPNGASKNGMYNIMISKSAGTYEPYISQEAEIDLDTLEYCKIGNYEDKFIRTSGKNLFDENKTKDNFFYNSSGTTTTDSTNKFINIEIPLKSSYTISWGNKINGGGIIAYARICEYNGNTFIKRTSIQDNNTTLTLDSNTTKVIASVDAGPNAYFVDLMINEGSTALPYEPYGSNEWYIKKNIGKVVLDGTEGWTYTSNSSYPFRLTFTNAIFTTSSNISPNVLCNYYSPFAWNIGTKPDYGTTATVDNPQIITFRNINITSKADWLTWLSNNNTTLYYPLATPTYTQITGTLETQLENVYQKLLSYSGTTTISQINADLPFNMSVLAIEE